MRRSLITLFVLLSIVGILIYTGATKAMLNPSRELWMLSANREPLRSVDVWRAKIAINFGANKSYRPNSSLPTTYDLAVKNGHKEISGAFD